MLPCSSVSSVAKTKDFTVVDKGAPNKAATSSQVLLPGVNWGRDLPEPMMVADLRNVVAGDMSPDGKGALVIERGIEVGHVFYLGTKYSQAMNATFSFQHVTQDDATKAKLRLRMKQNTFVAIANAARPKGHDLHITPGTSA